MTVLLWGCSSDNQVIYYSRDDLATIATNLCFSKWAMSMSYRCSTFSERWLCNTNDLYFECYDSTNYDLRNSIMTWILSNTKH